MLLEEVSNENAYMKKVDLTLGSIIQDDNNMADKACKRMKHEKHSVH